MLSLDLTEEGTVEVVDDTPDHRARFDGMILIIMVMTFSGPDGI